MHRAIAAHARAYAAYKARRAAEPYDEVELEPLIVAELRTAEVLARTVPTTLLGLATVLAHVRLLHERDNHPLFDDFHCYAFIASVETALRRVLGRSNGKPDSEGQRCVPQ